MTDTGDPLELLESLAQVHIDHDLLERALTHRSYAYENGGLPTNERLEFLGDSVLGVIVTETLYRAYPDLAEGQLAKLRAAVVNMRALADVSRALGLGEFIKLGRGEESTGGRDKSSILADGLEALIGAVYVDGGLAVATGLVHRLFDELIDDAADLRGAGDRPRRWVYSQQSILLLVSHPHRTAANRDATDLGAGKRHCLDDLGARRIDLADRVGVAQHPATGRVAGAQADSSDWNRADLVTRRVESKVGTRLSWSCRRHQHGLAGLERR